MTPLFKAIALALVLATVLASTFTAAQVPASSISAAPPVRSTGASVVFADETLFVVYDKLGPFTPQERAQAISERLSRHAKDPFTRIYPVAAADRETTSELVYGEMVVMTITDRDAQPTGKSRQEVAKE